MEDIIKLLTHEYTLGLYGVILWQIEQAFVKKDFTVRKAITNIGRSLSWVGGIVVFDDELISQYNRFASLDYPQPVWWMYIGAGFCIDIIRSRFFGDKNKKPTEPVEGI